MLRELHISNLAVIADAKIELTSGLNAFTGATGAGKSLVIGAIGVLLGFRSAAELLRSGAAEGRVSGLFEIADKHLLAQLSQATDLPLDADGGELLIVRRLYASGRTGVSLNGNPITLSMLKSVGELLVDVHGQHDQQYLLRPGNQLDVLDRYAGNDELLSEYRNAFDRLQSSRRRIEALDTGRKLREQQLEFSRFQAQEIDNGELDSAELAELEGRQAILTNLERLKRDAGAAHMGLYEADASVVSQLKTITGLLAELATLDRSLEELARRVRDATLTLEDSAYDLNRYIDRLDLDPAEMEEVQERLNVINRVLSKHGPGAEDALEKRRDLAKQIASLERETDDLDQLRKEIKPLEAKVKSVGESLSVRRAKAAKEIAPRVQSQLAELGMGKATFRVIVDTTEAAGATGYDAIEFMVRTNPGQPESALRKVASGGEMSRIMLALKGVLASGDRVSVLVFDEIDSNVGGRLGDVIGSKLRQLSRMHQVLTITHLPQIAAYADRHLTVRKAAGDASTETMVHPVEGEARTQELAEMIGGSKVTDITRAQARELQETAAEKPLKKPRKRSAV